MNIDVSWPAALTVVFTGIVVIGGYFANRRLGLTEGQRSLVSTLKDQVAALENDLKRVKVDKDECFERLERAEQTISDLRDEVFQLRTAITNKFLKEKNHPSNG